MPVAHPDGPEAPLEYLFQAGDGAEVIPVFYCESYKPSPRYVSPLDAVYHNAVPGAEGMTSFAVTPSQLDNMRVYYTVLGGTCVTEGTGNPDTGILPAGMYILDRDGKAEKLIVR